MVEAFILAAAIFFPKTACVHFILAYRRAIDEIGRRD